MPPGGQFGPVQVQEIKQNMRAWKAQPVNTINTQDLAVGIEWWAYAVAGVPARTDSAFPVYPFTPPDSAIYTDDNGNKFYRRPPVSAWGTNTVQLYQITFIPDPFSPDPKNPTSVSTPQFMPMEYIDPASGLVHPQLIKVYNWGKKAVPAKYFVRIEWSGVFWFISNADCLPVST